MAAATTPQSLSFEQFVRLYGGLDRDYEYWAGVVVQKPMPSYIHGLLQNVIGRLLREEGYIPATEVTLRIVPDFYPVPDLIATKTVDAMQPYPTRAPEVVVEILSEDDNMRYMLDKCRSYTRWGCPGVYVVDPFNHAVLRWSSQEGLRLVDKLAEVEGVRIWQELARDLNLATENL